MKNYILDKINSARKYGLLIDTNLLLLLFVGGFNTEWIAKFKRTQQFTEEDFFLLTDIVKQFGRILTTPFILTEVSNLSNQLPNEIKNEYYTAFAQHLELLEELYVPSIVIAKQPEFKKFGLTDAAIISLAREKSLVLTIDFPLANLLERAGLAVLNFNHLRGQIWFG